MRSPETRAYWRAWASKNRDKVRRGHKESLRRQKNRVMKLYGDHCTGCKTRERAVLTLDHVYDDGAARRKAGLDLRGKEFYRQLDKKPRRADLQILCGNCQLRKRVYGPAWLRLQCV